MGCNESKPAETKAPSAPTHKPNPAADFGFKAVEPKAAAPKAAAAEPAEPAEPAAEIARLAKRLDALAASSSDQTARLEKANVAVQALGSAAFPEPAAAVDPNVERKAALEQRLSNLEVAAAALDSRLVAMTAAATNANA
jgi:hypothetical protein